MGSGEGALFLTSFVLAGFDTFFVVDGLFRLFEPDVLVGAFEGILQHATSSKET